MPSEGRFDYLFEPLDVEEPAEHADAAGVPADSGASAGAAPMRMAFGAFVFAALAAVAVVAILLLRQPAAPQSPLDLPAGSSPAPTTAADVEPSVATEAPQAPTGTDSQTQTPVESAPAQQIAPAEPQPTRTSTPRAPQDSVSNSPTTRAPISVAPESRAPFPNQGPRAGDNGRGLLGGLL